MATNDSKQIVYVYKDQNKVVTIFKGTRGPSGASAGLTFSGTFDPSVDGGNNSKGTIINNSSDFETGDFVIAISDGTYNFDTGLTGSGTAVQVNDWWAYNGSTWDKIRDGSTLDIYVLLNPASSTDNIIEPTIDMQSLRLKVNSDNQTNNLFELLSATDTVVFSIDKQGDITQGTF